MRCSYRHPRTNRSIHARYMWPKTRKRYLSPNSETRLRPITDYSLFGAWQQRQPKSCSRYYSSTCLNHSTSTTSLLFRHLSKTHQQLFQIICTSGASVLYRSNAGRIPGYMQRVLSELAGSLPMLPSDPGEIDV